MNLPRLLRTLILGMLPLAASPAGVAVAQEAARHAAAPAGATAPAARKVAIAADRLREARAALARAENLKERRRALAAAIESYEAALGEMRAELRRLAIRSRKLEAELAARRADKATLLAALVDIARIPPPGLLVHNGGPVAAVRAAMILETSRARLRRRLARLVAGWREAETLRRRREEMVTAITAALAELQEARARLATAVAERRRGRLVPVKAALLADLARSAATLDEFAAALASDPATAHEETPARARPRLPRGARILYRSGEADAAGIRRPGLVLALPPAGLLTSPVDATVRYAGPLARYGNVIVLEPDPARLVIFSGLGTLYADTGDVVVTGDPLGLAAGRPPVPQDATDSPLLDTPASATLYLELREKGKPVDPLVWFTSSKD